MNSDRIHHTIAGAGLLLGALAFTGGDLLRRSVEPANGTPTTITQAVRDHSGMWLSAALLTLAASFLLVPGIVAAVRLVTGRGVTLTVLGGYLTGVGLLASLVHAAGYFGMYGRYARANLSGAALTSFDTAADNYLFFVIGIVGFMVGMTLGPLLLTIGLRRARVVPIWVPVAAVVFVVAGTVSGVPAGVAGLIAAAVTFGTVAICVLRQRPLSSPASGTTTVEPAVSAA